MYFLTQQNNYSPPQVDIVLGRSIFKVAFSNLPILFRNIVVVKISDRSPDKSYRRGVEVLTLVSLPAKSVEFQLRSGKMFKVQP
jgi:hypothetical protein